MDCPGYGTSTGDRQIVRSYPTQFISAVVKLLGLSHLFAIFKYSLVGKSKALALVGCSQGGCAVFNCALEMPSLCQYILQVTSTLYLCAPTSI